MTRRSPDLASSNAGADCVKFCKIKASSRRCWRTLNVRSEAIDLSAPASAMGASMPRHAPAGSGRTMLCRPEPKHGMEKSAVSSRASVMAMAEIAMPASSANSGGAVLFAFQAGRKALFGGGLSRRYMICPFKAGWSGCRCINIAIGHPPAGDCARWAIAGLSLHIEREPTIGLPGTLREADAAAVFKPDRAVQVDGLVSQCHLADVPGQRGALTATGRVCRDIVRHPWRKPCSPWATLVAIGTPTIADAAKNAPIVLIQLIIDVPHFAFISGPYSIGPSSASFGRRGHVAVSVKPRKARGGKPGCERQIRSHIGRR
jgi:hypothetical protein